MSWSFLDFTGLSHFFGRLPEKLVTTDTTQSISGTKSFSSTILGSVSGSAATATTAATATKLATARTIALSGAATGTATGFDGSGNITIPVTALDASKLTGTASVSTTGNAATATTATTAKACTGNAATATKATQDSDGNKITTTYSKNGHTHDDRYYTEAEVNELLAGKANSSHTHPYIPTSASCNKNWHWEGQGGQPSWLWGGEDGTNMYVYNPSDFRVNYANSANSAVTANCAKSVRTPDNSHTIIFDWDSQVPGCVGITVDATRMGGIITTALAASAIRAQWYAAYPDGAEAHNAMWGGRDITAAFDAGTVSEHIADGTFRDIFPGDYITKQVTIPQVLADDGTTELFAGGTYTVNWVIADCDYWINKGDTATTAHHVVIVPQVPIFSARMNATNTTEGGYAGSEMYRNVIPACATGIVSAFGSSHILTFRDSITRAVNTSSISSGAPFWTGASSDWGWYDAQCNLMCERMVYGMPAFSSSAWDAGVATRQFSAFRLSERLINYNRQWWWLRDVVSSAHFAGVGGGYAHASGASGVGGVRPFALLV